MANKEIPELKKLVDVARNTVFTARRRNTLSSLTVKTVRRQVEKYFCLEEGVLEREDLKVALRNAVNEALEDPLPPQPTKCQEKVEDSELASRTIKRTPSQQARVKNEEEIIPNIKLKVKSREIIEASTDSEGKQVTGKVIRAERRSLIQTAKGTKRAKDEDEEENTYTSDVSSVIEQPKKKRRTSKARIDDKTLEKNKGLDETPEETVKRLKSLVKACGRRPLWEREFAGLIEPGQRIRHLKRMLSDLGMKNNYSIQAARAIKHERDLARELRDVIEFEKKAGLSRRRRDGRGELDTETEDEAN